MAVPCGMRDLSSQTRDKPMPPALRAWSLNHWTAREVPPFEIFKAHLILIFSLKRYFNACSR